MNKEKLPSIYNYELKLLPNGKVVDDTSMEWYSDEDMIEVNEPIEVVLKFIKGFEHR